VVGNDRPGEARSGECEPDAAVAELLCHSAAMVCIIRYNSVPWMAVLQAMHSECATCMHAETSTHLAEIVLNLADDHGHGLGRAVLCELRHEHVALAVAFVELFRCLPVGALGAIDVTSGSVSALATDL
jgi:hypothetical protein